MPNCSFTFTDSFSENTANYIVYFYFGLTFMNIYFNCAIMKIIIGIKQWRQKSALIMVIWKMAKKNISEISEVKPDHFRCSHKPYLICLLHCVRTFFSPSDSSLPLSTLCHGQWQLAPPRATQPRQLPWRLKCLEGIFYTFLNTLFSKIWCQMPQLLKFQAISTVLAPR